MDKKVSELVYELAAAIFIATSTADKDNYPGSYEAEHQANWSIETARIFVEVATARGLIKTPAGLFGGIADND